MHLRKSLFGILGIFVLMCGVTISLKASYYKPDFFPIGLTGLNYTGSGTPYGNVKDESNRQMWFWDDNPYYSDQTEKALIEALGVNCLGCEDAYRRYILSWGDTSANQNNYLQKVSQPSLTSDNPIYLITVSYRAERYLDTLSYPGSCTNPDTIHVELPCTDIPTCAFFRDYIRQDDGVGPVKFKPSEGNEPRGCYGTSTDNWDKEGDTSWCKMADTAIYHFQEYLKHDSLAECIWGYNLITEDPAVSRKYKDLNPWRGCWAAVDRIFTGHDFTSSFYGDLDTASHHGIRGVEDSLSMDHRMIVAKYGVAALHREEDNIFTWLPDIDIFVIYFHQWCKAQWNYGQQEVFDNLLYDISSGAQYKSGYHNDAIYFQKYGQTNLRSGQERRWIAAPGLEWNQFPSTNSLPNRRPCPPEIRCATYLSLSRGAKGILYHGWTFTPNDLWPGSDLEIPHSGKWTGGGNVGIRDHYGYPFGNPASPAYDDHHWLNNGVSSGADSTVWHSGDTSNVLDTTYNYLCTLIPEIKAISGVLMQLEWENAYSLKTTCGKDTFCPLDYVDSVTTTDSGYIDLGFFSPYYWQDYGKYLMVVNRDGIAQMDTAIITLYLDFPEGDSLDSLHVTEFGDPDTDTILVKDTSDNRFHLTRDYAPGEGKLFRFESRKA